MRSSPLVRINRSGSGIDRVESLSATAFSSTAAGLSAPLAASSAMARAATAMSHRPL